MEGLLLRWNHSPEEIGEITDALIEEDRRLEDEVASVPLNSVTFENTAAKLIQVSTDHLPVLRNLDFYQNVSPDKNLRDASVAADKKILQLQC
mmetsp:Transcript_941/g.1222  ORF Transcript_941/g.1222 Transcript_941/m.1222 type:complete len:93 (+) Transcript_941:145-423(+)